MILELRSLVLLLSVYFGKLEADANRTLTQVCFSGVSNKVIITKQSFHVIRVLGAQGFIFKEKGKP